MPTRRTIRSIERVALRKLQEPLKERYRAEPEHALVTLHAEGYLRAGITCSLQTGRALASHLVRR